VSVFLSYLLSRRCEKYYLSNYYEGVKEYQEIRRKVSDLVPVSVNKIREVIKKYVDVSPLPASYSVCRERSLSPTCSTPTLSDLRPFRVGRRSAVSLILGIVAS